MTPVITQINLYPIKSCGGVALPSATIGQRGLEAGKIGDRRWMVSDDQGVMITQRQNENLARVRIELAGDALRLTGDGLEPVIADPAEVGEERIPVQLFGREVVGHRAPEAVNAWFSRFLGQKAHLLYQKDEDLRLCDADFAVTPGIDRVGFADAFPYLLATEATLAKVNTLLAEPVPMNRFRPNFVMGNTGPDAEYGWKRLTLGTAELEIVKPCSRCVMTTIDQERGEKTGKEPLATLGSAYYFSGQVGRGTVKGAMFGENAIPTRLGTVSLGDKVTVLESKLPHLFRVAALALGLLLAGPSLAQPEGAPPTAMIPAPEDAAYPGTLTLSVDATDVARHVFTVHESIPVAGPGPMTLLFPKWLPGEHAPTGPIAQLAGLMVTANGQRLEWQRDPVEVTAFHVKIPAGVNRIDVSLQRLAMSEEGFGGTVVTSNIMAVKWSSLSLYPAGYAVSRIQIRPDVTLPHGWSYAAGLDGAKVSGDTVSFAATTYETLVDSPLYAGRLSRQFDLDPGAKTPVHLTVFADHEEDLDAKPEQIEAHRALVSQAYKLFGSRHYDHYDFLLALNEKMSDLGIEHHRSSENGYNPKYFGDWDGTFFDHDLLAHEFTHSWNGKFRRPADLWTPDYNQPMRDSLLWVYEGQTQYWGEVLAARSGLLSHAQFLDKLAVYGALMDLQAGRAWRSLQDTTYGEILNQRSQRTYNNWTRGLDYYVEGALIWLDADTLIRDKSQGTKSLDDFARSFFGTKDGQMTPETYRFDDVVAALNAVQPYDWATFLRSRLDGHGNGGPLEGLLRGGYRLTFNDQPNSALIAEDTDYKQMNLTFSLGLVLSREGMVTEVAWNSPAFKAGIPPGAQVIAVNSYPLDGGELMKPAIIAAEKPGSAPIELLIKADERYRMVQIDYHGGLRYPHLDPMGENALIDKITEPKE